MVSILRMIARVRRVGVAKQSSRGTVSDVVLHPVRLRILQEVGLREVTTSQLREALPDVTPATLYRHVKALLEADVLTVVSERKVRGAVERTLAAGPRQAHVDAQEAASITPAQMRQGFLAFVGHLTGEVDRYLSAPATPATGGFGFNLTSLYLDDADLPALQAELTALLERYRADAPGKRRTLLGTVLVPAHEVD